METLDTESSEYTLVRMMLSMGGCLTGTASILEDEPTPVEYEELEEQYEPEPAEMKQQELKPSELLFLREFRKMLSNGFELIKHDQGAMETHTLKIQDETICWTDGRVPLSEIEAIERGAGGVAPPVVEHKCLVLVTTQSSAVFETVDGNTRELIADGFDLLLTHHRSLR